MVAKAFRPFTLSPVLLVALAQPPAAASHDDQLSLPASAILKLYDRRCLVNARDTFDEGMPWSLNKERGYRRYLHDVATGAVARADFASPTYLRADRVISDGEFEAYLQHTARQDVTRGARDVRATARPPRDEDPYAVRHRRARDRHSRRLS